jgi:signal transduction histidine kinase
MGPIFLAGRGRPGLTTRLWLRLQGPEDTLLLEPEGGGERLVARVRLYLVFGLLIIQLWPGTDPALYRVLVPLDLGALLYTGAAYLLVFHRYSRWMGLATSAVDVTLVTFALAAFVLVGVPHGSGSSLAVFEIYFLVLGAAALRFDWRVSAFAGALVVVEYVVLVALSAIQRGMALAVLAHLDLSVPAEASIADGRFWSVQYARCAILAAAAVLSVVSVVRARQLRKHLAEAIRTAEQGERRKERAIAEERQRLSRDLHDSVTQLLFSVSLVAQSIGPAWRRDRAEGERKIERLLDLTRTALGEMRALIGELRPAELVLELERAESALRGISRIRKDGLAAALRRHAREAAGDSLWVDVDDSGYKAQPLAREEVLYRIAQEALSNVQKHARARFVSLSLAVRGGEVRFTVVDDGVGFDAEQALVRVWTGPYTEGGFGLISMRERVEALGGVFRLHSSPGEGTTVHVALPRAD